MYCYSSVHSYTPCSMQTSIRIMYVAITHGLLAIPTSNLLAWKKAIRRIFEQKIKAIKISVFEIIKIKGKSHIFVVWPFPLSNYNELYITWKRI